MDEKEIVMISYGIFIKYMKTILNAIPDNTGTRTKNHFNGDKKTIEEITNTATTAHKVDVLCPSIILSENFILIIG